MPGIDGLEFLQAVRERYPDLPFILFTGEGSETVASDAIAAGVTDYLQKGSGTEQYELLANRIRNAVRARREDERADRQEQLMRLTEFAGDTDGFELDREINTILLTAGTRRIIGRPEMFEITLQEALESCGNEGPADLNGRFAPVSRNRHGPTQPAHCGHPTLECLRTVNFTSEIYTIR